jgi:hypothetical protein
MIQIIEIMVTLITIVVWKKVCVILPTYEQMLTITKFVDQILFMYHPNLWQE